MRTKKIVFFVSSLGVGGAEMMIVKLAGQLHSPKLQFHVVSMGKPNTLKDRLQEFGVQVTELNLGKNPLNLLRLPFKLYRIFQDDADYILQGWMYHGNLLSHLAKFFVKPLHHYIAIRQTLPDITNQKKLTQLIIRLDAWLSKWADKTLYVAQAAVPQHLAVGYTSKNVEVIPNGFDVNNYYPDSESRKNLREKMNIADKDLVIGHVARLHPMKDHKSFISSINELMNTHSHLKAVLIGKNVNYEEFQTLISEKNRNRFIFLGEQKNLHQWTNTFDLAVSSSAYGEGFSNTIGEAMSCGIPCLVTDVGDSAWIVGDTGFVVPPSRTDLLKAKLNEVINNQDSLRKRGVRARKRVLDNFTIEYVCGIYKNIWS